MSNYDTVSGSLDQISIIVERGVDALTEQSLHEYTAPTNFNALYLVDERVANSPVLKDLLGLQLLLTTARIVQAFELRNTIKGISVIDHIKSARLGISENKSLFRRIFGLENIDIIVDQTNPETNEVSNKNTIEELIKKGTFGNKCINEVTLDEITTKPLIDDESNIIGTEAANVVTSVDTKNIISDSDSIISNYAVGSTFNITLQDNSNNSSEKVVVTLGLRISPVAVNPDVVKAILSIGSYRNSFMERFYSLRAGDIDLMQFLTLSDIVDQQVGILLKDKSGYYREVLKRQKANNKFGLFSFLSGKKIERAKTIGGLILDAQTLAEAEVALGGTFDDPQIRNRVFLTTSAASICVIDGGWETIKIYYRGIDYVETYTFGQIRRSGKGGVSVEDMLEAFRRGGAPRL